MKKQGCEEGREGVGGLDVVMHKSSMIQPDQLLDVSWVHHSCWELIS